MTQSTSLPPAAWPRDPLVAPGLRDGAAADALPAIWREDANQLALVIGAWTANFLPAAWIVEGSVSTDLLDFAIRIVFGGAICTALQLATLRRLRQAPLGFLRRSFVQWAVLAAGGVVLQVTVSHATVVVGGQHLRVEEGGWWTGAVGAWASVLVALYLVWQREARDRALSAAQRLRSIQRAQLAVRRTLAEQELLALQAQIDPELFFGALDAIQALHESEPARAEALLDELIAFLRAALPRSADGRSTLGGEIDVAAAFVRMHARAQGNDVSLASKVDCALLHMPMTPGLLLPLLRGTLHACTGPTRLQLGARLTSSGMLELTLETPLQPDDATCAAVDAAMRSVHGASAALSCSSGAVHLRVPHVAA